jgi:hypothetical protein
MRRPGITLLEVLSAIFITGIGLLSLLTLFPLGALKMLEAVNDDRTALAGGNGKAIANAVEMRLDPVVQRAMLGQTFSNSQITPDGPGYPVLVDPIGRLAFGTGQPLWQSWVGGIPNIMPRVAGSWIAPNALDTPATIDCLRWCTLLDDLEFNSDGAYQGQTQDPPAWVGGFGSVQRNLRFSYAWLLRMPRVAAPNVVDVSVLVFAGRSLDLVGFGTQEASYSAVFNAQSNTVALYPNAAAGTTDVPSLRRGQWIIDTSYGVNPNTTTLSVRGFCYRIVSVSDPAVDANGNAYVTVEVQTPLRGWSATTIDPAFPVTPIAGGPAVQGQLGSVVIFDNLLEVFDDGTF